MLPHFSVKWLLVFFALTSLVSGQIFTETGRIGGSGRAPGFFSRPSAVAVSEEGKLFVVDTGNNRIQVFTADGKFLETVGGFGFQANQFDQPVDIWAGNLINVYVADYNNNRLVRYDRQMNYISALESRESYPAEYQFREVLSCVVSSQNDLFVLDRGENKIIKFNGSGQPERSFGSYESGSGELLEPVQLDLIDQRVLLVSDTDRHSVMMFDLFGNYIRELKSRLWKTPRGLCTAGSSHIVVTDPDLKKLFMVRFPGNKITEFNLTLAEPLQQPQDAAVFLSTKENIPEKSMYILDGDYLIMGTLYF